MSTPVSVGRISKLFGHEGEVVLNLYDNFPEEPDMKEPLLVRIDSLTVPLFFDEFRRRGQSGGVARFADFDTPERVSELLGLELFAHVDDSDAEYDGDDMFLEDFVGYTALFVGREDLTGIVDHFIDHDHNPIFAVMVSDSEVLVPAADDLIAEFDTKARTVTFDLPEGLLELYI